ncbi:hypothetical protein G5V59_03885 [Nocardioides sp. W3-2-3]|nr:hypothetical protein [Nocardioides convexus]
MPGILTGVAPMPVAQRWTPSSYPVPEEVAEAPRSVVLGQHRLRVRVGGRGTARAGPADRRRARAVRARQRRDGAVRGRGGLPPGETLLVRRDDAGTVLSLECATFVYTRTPYDARVTIPGGHPAPGTPSPPTPGPAAH